MKRIIKQLNKKLPELCVCVGVIRNVKVEHHNKQTEMLRHTVMEQVKSRHKLEQLKTNPTVRAYRIFFWKLGVDPTKTRPSSEALVRRVLHGKEVPHVSTVVDAYNLASLKTMISLSGFDLDLVSLPLCIRFSRENEEFLGIGMDAAAKLKDRMLVLADKKQIMCIYPHRDADATKITNRTKNVLIVGYGATGINGSLLVEAVKTALSYIQTTSNGDIEETKMYKLTDVSSAVQLHSCQ